MQNLIIRNDLYNQIKYRENVIRGTVTAVNNNGTYNVRFKCESISYPNVSTYAKNSNLQIGDRVTVLFEGRNREMPKILAFADNYSEEDNRVKHSDWILEEPAVAGIYVVYKKTSDGKYYLVRINSDDSITEIAELPELATGNDAKLVRILTDSSGNIYALKQENDGSYVPYQLTWFKYNSSGILQISKITIGTKQLEGFIALDGYLYTHNFDGDKLYKRSLSTLEIEEIISLTIGHRYRYLCFDSDGHLYTYDRDFTEGAAFVKWELKNAVLESHVQGAQSLSSWNDWSLLGDNIVTDSNILSTGYSGIIDIPLASNMITWSANDIPNWQWCGVANDRTYRYVLGENTADNKLIVEKYNAAKILQVTIEISADYISNNRRYYGAITAYPF